MTQKSHAISPANGREAASDGLCPPNERERTAIDDAKARNRGRSPSVRTRITEQGAGHWTVDPAHSDELGWVERLQDTFATDSEAAVGEHLDNIVKVTIGHGVTQPHSADAGVAFVAALNPRDEVEAALAVQMYGAHVSAMRMMVRAGKADQLDQAAAFTNMATKFQRTFTMQMEALSKMRRGGEQIVRHIHVDNRGGQAVIADTVHTGGGGRKENAIGQAHAPVGDAHFAALPGQDPLRWSVPISSDAERQVPDARWEIDRSTEG